MTPEGAVVVSTDRSLYELSPRVQPDCKASGAARRRPGHAINRRAPPHVVAAATPPSIADGMPFTPVPLKQPQGPRGQTVRPRPPASVLVRPPLHRTSASAPCTDDSCRSPSPAGPNRACNTHLPSHHIRHGHDASPAGERLRHYNRDHHLHLGPTRWSPQRSPRPARSGLDVA